MRTLDRTKPYGEVWGEAGGAKFEQDGILFDAHGRELKKPVQEVAEVLEAPKPAVTKAKAKAKQKTEAEAEAETAPLPADESPVEAATDGQADAQLAAE